MNYKLIRKFLFLSVSSLVIASCTRGPFVSNEVTSSVARQNSDLGYGFEITDERSASDAFLELPMEAGEIISVSQKNYSNGASQRIIYRSGAGVIGENYVQVRATKLKSYNKSRTETLDVHNNELATLRREFSKEFPGQKFVVNSSPRRNGYGLFGHVFFKRGGNQNCLFGWQAARSEVKKGNIFQKFRNKPIDITLRFRFCGNQMKEDSAVAVIRRMKIVLDPRDFVKRNEYIWTDGQEDRSYLSESDALSAGYRSDEINGGVQYLDQPDPVRKRVSTKKKPVVERMQIEKPQVQKPNSKKQKVTGLVVPLPTTRADLSGESGLVPEPNYPKNLPDAAKSVEHSNVQDRFGAPPAQQNSAQRKVRIIPEPLAQPMPQTETAKIASEVRRAQEKTKSSDQILIPLPE